MDIIGQIQRDGFTVNKSTATVLTSQSRSSTVNSADLTNRYAKGVKVYVDVASVSGSAPTLDVKLQSKDSVASKYIDIPGAAFATISGATTLALTVYPGIAETANVSVSDVLTFNWRVVGTIGGGAPFFEFGVDADYIA